MKKQRLSDQKQDYEAKITKVKNIPEKFIKQVVSLGFQETDAAVLYKDKENWIGAGKGMVIRTLIFRRIILGII